MGSEYLPLLFAVIIAIVFSLVFVGLSKYFGPNTPTASKESVYECGVRPIGSARQRFSVKFYLTAVLFILFDLEAVFLYPWAVVFRDYVYQDPAGLGLFMAGEMALFLGVLFLGWLYVVKRGALDWTS
ncbi:MAG: NADH-quinone oxidoreductase subunit A [Alphaproteobacteria bacterium]|nr:NADH-quinone oxidoreductase subunit A [Alphaproteobacteria bacterium]MCB9796366.1 NADH-quinone oxidoreductase subunit A [Alphaproteobacteria bacterium]